LSKVANFSYSTCIIAPVGMTSFHGVLRQQKTRVLGLSHGIACMILRLAVLVQDRHVMNRRPIPH